MWGTRLLATLLTGLALLTAAAPVTATEPNDGYTSHHFTGGSIFDLGDSHTWLAGGGTQYPVWDTNCRPGRDSTAAVEVLAEWLRPRHKEVVFDLATNDHDDPVTFRANLRQVWSLLGPDRELLLVTTHSEKFSTYAINQEIRDFVALHPNRSEFLNWAAWARDHPNAMSDDGVHFTAAGYESRTTLVKAAVADG